MSAAPQRIQRSRRAGWRLPSGAVYVGRPTRWGNPFRPTQLYMPAVLPHEIEVVLHSLVGGGSITSYWVNGRRGVPMIPVPGGGPLGIDGALKLYHGHILETVGETVIRTELGGRDLCCWCAPVVRCHADVLLEIANKTSGEDA